MTTTTPTLQWAQGVPPAEIRSGVQLDELLDKAEGACRPGFPISVILKAHGFQAHILLGLPESFVYLDEVSPTRYFITVGDSYIDGDIEFYLLGQHHTEFERRHLIPADKARRVLREFFDTGCKSEIVGWEEGSY